MYVLLEETIVAILVSFFLKMDTYIEDNYKLRHYDFFLILTFLIHFNKLKVPESFSDYFLLFYLSVSFLRYYQSGFLVDLSAVLSKCSGGLSAT